MPDSTRGESSRRRSRSREARRDDYRARDKDRDHHKRRSRSRSREASPRSSARRRSRSRSPRGRPHSHSRRRSHSRERSRERHRHHRRKRSRSTSSSSSSSSEDGSERRKRRKEKKKERKEKKREKKDKKKKKKSAAASSHWGKYGVISESDFYNKSHEFRTWLLEERKVNPETISKDQERKDFAVFVEDFNTATLPHEKYYNMDAYETRMASLRAGETLPPADDGYDPAADLRAHGAAHRRAAVEHESYLSKEQLLELRRVQHERVQAAKMKRMGMEVGQSMGVRMDGTKFDEV
ncbi:hypothetical protein CONPUDRAFT_137666 [Coniophora puteana RWD-64-598 SS2]|uniref:Uncharacterized protein n=1 Tax=Coniophora puteana (strain RWD-64-598) TaxID=741705 RepID=A0A5M3MN45_CONPW|nr:uncharacterized protein CONPUDRAFT_137666 [Coniophora puteana RWD-64-598 SS2]EIW80477.1 hypothetical protein CONPUDRAFT_137666 [Coniophora puteana RWD-64-598 SS2]